METQNNALVVDPFPGKCSVCNQNTGNPHQSAKYTARWNKIKQDYRTTSTGYKVVDTIQYSEIMKHPLRICDNCVAIKGNLSKIIIIASIVANPFAIFIGNVFKDEDPVFAGISCGLILFRSILAFTHTSPESIRSGRQYTNLIRYRIEYSDSREETYTVLSKDELLNLR